MGGKRSYNPAGFFRDSRRKIGALSEKWGLVKNRDESRERDRAVYKLTRYRYVAAKWRVIKVAISPKPFERFEIVGLVEKKFLLFLRIPGDRSMKRSFSRYIVSNSGGGVRSISRVADFP